MRTAEDNRPTTQWAIASLAGAAAGASYQEFMLANRVTGRAHVIFFVGGGLTIGKDLSVSKRLVYTNFNTRRRVNFRAFEGCGARLTQGSAVVGVGFSRTYLTIWESHAYISPVLARIRLGGLELSRKISLKGQAAAHGAIGVRYGNGDPLGLIERVIDPERLEEARREREADRRREMRGVNVQVRVSARESSLMVFPDDVLFNFDSAQLKPDAKRHLERAAEMILSRDRGWTTIVGHTDSVGDPAYNERLSLRRALSVKRWFVEQTVFGSHSFTVRGMGEKQAIAPNRFPDGRDNPEGRAKNRRVEIHFE